MAPTSEIRYLMDCLLDQGKLNLFETRRLEELLQNRNALNYYIEVTALDALMAEALDGIEVEKKTLRFPIPKLAIGVMAAAACLVISLLILMLADKPLVRPHLASTSVDVKVTGLQGVNWEMTRPPVLPNGNLADKRVVMRSGLLELTYASGVRVTLQGDTDFTVRDTTSGTLTQGKLVAYVPPGAEGFTIDYGTGSVVDLGTEFGLAREGGKIELSVFDGAVMINLPDGTSQSVNKGQALVHDGGSEDGAREIPQDPNKFIRDITSSEFQWELKTNELSEIEVDVTHLISKASKYMAIFQWQEGLDATAIWDVELQLNGQSVAADSHRGKTGEPIYVNNNWFVLDLPTEKYAPGRWTLHAKLRTLPRHAGHLSPKDKILSKGVLLFEEGLISHATAADYIGRWSYPVENKQYICEFHKDGKATYTVNGRPASWQFNEARWEIDGGVLKVWFPKRLYTECHILRDAKTLTFITERKANAVKIEDE